MGTEMKPADPKEIGSRPPLFDPRPCEALPERRRGAIATDAVDPYDTFMNGLRVAPESYGVFGYCVYNRHDIRVSGQDNIFITAEPRNLAPLESVIVYRSDGPPYLAIFDWGANGKGWHHIVGLEDEQFIARFARRMTTPNGEQVYAFCFQNFFNAQLNRNQVLLSDRDNRWEAMYTSPTAGRPAVAPANVASGWAVLEYKRLRGTPVPWAQVPHMLGFLGLQLMDAKGAWYRPAGPQTVLKEESPQYVRVIAEPNVSCTYRSR